MSRGPGRIERAIRALFDAHPGLAFVTDELVEHCYPEAKRVNDRQQRVAAIEARFARKSVLPNDPGLAERASRQRHAAAESVAGPGVLEFPRKYQVAVLRAAKKVIARDPDWTAREAESQGGTWVFFNCANVQSYALGRLIGGYREIYRSPKRMRRHDRAERSHDGCSWCRVIKDRDAALKLLYSPSYGYLCRMAPPGAGPRQGNDGMWFAAVARHIAYRDGDAETRAAMEAEDAAALAAWIASAPSLSKRFEAAPPPATQPLELAEITARLRALAVQNDPDAVRAGLAEIADTLDALRAAIP